MNTFTVVSEVGDEYTVDQVACGEETVGRGIKRYEFIGRGLGLLRQLGEHQFQSNSHPELILTSKVGG